MSSCTNICAHKPRHGVQWDSESCRAQSDNYACKFQGPTQPLRWEPRPIGPAGNAYPHTLTAVAAPSPYHTLTVVKVVRAAVLVMCELTKQTKTPTDTEHVHRCAGAQVCRQGRTTPFQRL